MDVLPFEILDPCRIPVDLETDVLVCPQMSGLDLLIFGVAVVVDPEHLRLGVKFDSVQPAIGAKERLGMVC